MNKLDNDYKELLQDILTNGVKKNDRTGTGTLSVFGRQIRHKMSDGKFPIITTKKMYFKGIVTELIWFLRGDTNIKYLVDNDCHIWDGDCYNFYLKKYEKDKLHGVIYENDETQNRPFSKEEFINWVKNNDKFSELYGELGPIYGSQWRKWKFTDKFTNGEQIAYVNGKIDQIANLIHDLKTNPDSRRLMVSAWNPADLPHQVLPPCHYGFQVYTRELSEDERNEIRDMQYLKNKLHQALKGSDTKIDWENIPTRAISLMYNARSQDVPLGTPFNISSYALLLVILGKMVNMIPDELIANMGDCHIYSNQIDGIKEQLTREPYQLPTLKINSGNENWHLLDLDEVLNTLDPSLTFKLENYQSHPTIKLPLSN